MMPTVWQSVVDLIIFRLTSFTEIKLESMLVNKTIFLKQGSILSD